MGVKNASLHFCTSEAWGGLESYVCTLVSELRRLGEPVQVVCKPGSKIDSFLQGIGVPTVHLPSYSVVSLRSIRFLNELKAREGIGVFHVHFHSDIWLASLALRSDLERKLFLSIYMGVPRKKDLFHRFIYKRIDGVFTSSEELNARLPDLYPIDPSKIHLLPYGRVLERFHCDHVRRESIRKNLGVLHGETLVGTALRIDPGKGVMDFAHSFSYIDPRLQSSTRYVIIGEPTRKGRTGSHESPFEERSTQYLRDLESYIGSRGLEDRVRLIGFQEDIVSYLGAMDVFVFPSRDELYSLAVLDAMVMGLPVVASRAGGNVRQVQHGVNGLLYTNGDPQDLSRHLSEYLRDPELRQRHGMAARDFVKQNHDMRTTLERLLSHYHSTSHRR